jgi:nucleoside-diphosphate-sugar epimerase
LVRGVSEKQFDHVNVDGVARLVQSAKKQHRSPRFLLISSLAAKDPILSHYAASKRKGEELLAAEADGLKWSIFRPCAVYGPGDREIRPLLLWMKRGVAVVLGSQETRFSLLYVDDLTEAVSLWLKKDCRPPRLFELHDGRTNGYSINDVIAVFARLRGQRVFKLQVPTDFLKILAHLNVVAARTFGYFPMLTPGKVRELLHPSWVCDNTEISNALGWVPRVTLDKGVSLTLGWEGF